VRSVLVWEEEEEGWQGRVGWLAAGPNVEGKIILE
jgi:hypothetical protein